MARVLVDADALAYSCGFAAQRVIYDWTVHRNGVVEWEGVAQTKDEVSAIPSLLPGPGYEIDVQTIIEPEPLVNALGLCKRSLYAIESAIDEAKLPFDKLELFLTGGDNFRMNIATIRGYKANRIGIERPVHYTAIRRYMTERWGAMTVHGIEADDALAMLACQHEYNPDRVCIVSMDKDLRTVPGRLYNFKSRKMEILYPLDAMRAFYRQLVTGDVTDNIMGCYKGGPKLAMDLVPEHCPGEWEAYEAVQRAYVQSMNRRGCPYPDPDAALLENARLLHLLRKTGQMWQPPSERRYMEYYLP